MKATVATATVNTKFFFRYAGALSPFAGRSFNPLDVLHVFHLALFERVANRGEFSYLCVAI